ncbi:MAG: hypothetical protein GZ091_16225 [Paludibacter sp.]|nr:hypothetical protein [Paludibacter sp.]
MYKYQTEIEALNECNIKCPPEELYSFDGTLYRFVHPTDCKEHRNNNLPIAKIKPGRRLDKEIKCIAHASLSCFDSDKEAGVFILKRSFDNKKIYKSVGCCIAEFQVSETDGTRTDSTENGHFSFFEYRGTDLNNKYKITRELTKCNP